MFNEEISFFIKLFSIVFLGLFSGVDAETFSWQKSWRVSSYVGIIWCVGRFSTTTSKYLLTIHRSAALKFAKKGKKIHFHQKICSFLSNHWYICLKMALKLKFWWNFLITLNLAFWGNNANFWNYTFFQFQSTMLGFLCTVFPFGRKRNKPMCYIITYWRNV